MNQNYFTDDQPVDYEVIANDNNRHLNYASYKELEGVEWHINKHNKLINFVIYLLIVAIFIIILM